MNQPDHDKHSLRWLSRDYSELRARRADVFDVLIVGSGYGGSMAAAQLAGLQVFIGKDAAGQDKYRRATVCVLERGKEYAPGMFASSLQELPPHVRVHRRGAGKIIGRPDALLDVRVGPHVSAILGNGLGGGSLINAGVMEKPRWRKGQQLPGKLRDELDDALFDEVKKALGAGTFSTEHPHLAGKRLAKTMALQRVAAKADHASFRDAAITVQTRDDDLDVPQCTLCGDCMTGCNVGAKRSLDTTLLARAHASGAEIYTGGTVLKLERDGAEWVLHTVFTDSGLRERHAAHPVRARKVILAAGTLGSTEILMHSRAALSLSRRLGSGFSCNGDNIVAVHGGPRPVHSTEDEWVPLDARKVGPTITGVVEFARPLATAPDVPAPLIQEFAVPAALSRLFAEMVTTARLLNRLPHWPHRSRGQKERGLDSMAVDPDAMENTLLVGLIGHDESNGHIVVPQDPELEGGAGIEWSEVRHSPLMEAGYEQARAALARAARGADVLPNPAWRPMPKDLESLVAERGPVLTVHPLGGCPMGTSHLDGVVNHLGQVFRVTDRGNEVYEDLVVLDGSILPGSVGANPALTIASLAMRAARQLARKWEWVAPPKATGAPQARPAPAAPGDRQAAPDLVIANQAAASGALTADPVPTIPPWLMRVGDGFWRALGLNRAAAPLVQRKPPQRERNRPEYRKPAACTPTEPGPTQVELVERLAGPAGEKEQYWVELTLCYVRTDLAGLTGQQHRKVELWPPKSFLRIYDNTTDARRTLLTLSEHHRAARAWFCAHLSGSMTISEPRTGLAGVFHGMFAARAWWINRGKREIWDLVTGKEQRKLKIWPFICSAMRAGERRVFSYDMTVQDEEKVQAPAAEAPRLAPGTRVRGTKRLTYSVHGNPWLQLTELQLTDFPLGGPEPVLRLDGRFIAKQGVPLLRIIRQENQVVALAEVASFLLCWMRMLVSIHLWSFRAPDAAPAHEPKLLPGPITGVAAPRHVELRMERVFSPIPAFVRLTNYPNAGKPPVVLIHGYSASGSTFTHEAIPQPLARHLWAAGRDVWVLDLRTSAGMPTARQPWAFEDAAFADLPRALAYIREQTGQRVSVFAHCIGAVMLSMALLTDPADLPAFDHPRGTGPTPRRWAAELAALGDNIERIVLSQKGPMLVYCDDNVLRAYFMRVLRRVVLPEDYQFRVTTRQSLAGGLMDRVLSTLPYPRDEFARENPETPWERTPWAGFRHRMDALYARDFKLANVADETLAAIEDLFGPLNLDTVSQAIHFARRNTVTDRAGRPFDTSRSVLQARWPRRGTVSIHGRENGLVDVKTVDAMRAQMGFAGIPYQAFEIPGYGHQDCLIGRHAARDVFPIISANL